MGPIIDANISGFVMLLPDFKSTALLPLFEAVSNSIHALEDVNEIATGQIEIKVVREKSLGLYEKDDEDALPPIYGFEVIDTGIGFNKENFDSFNVAATEHKLERGGKGVGRFYWLKSFEKVEISSIYSENGGRRIREIDFTISNGVNEKVNDETDEKRQTSVKLNGFKSEYQSLPSAYKTTPKIAQRILEHYLSFFINGKSPNIIVTDATQGISIDLKEEYSKISKHLYQEKITIKRETFEISHLRLYSTYSKAHNIYYCADGRVVKPFPLSYELGTSKHFDEEEQKFIYAVYVSGDYLDKTVVTTRMDFSLPISNEQCDAFLPISMNELKLRVIEKSKIYLREFIESLMTRKKEKVENYIGKNNPALIAVPKHCPEIYDEIELNTSEEKMDEILFRSKGKAEYSIRKESNKLLKSQAKSIEEVEEEFKSISDKIDDFKKASLTEYIVYRKMIIELLKKKLNLNVDGKYENESIIHDIIFPMKSTTHEIGSDKHNMWLIDERLSYHQYAASDKYSTEESDNRPDIVVYSDTDDDGISRAVSIVELKKPGRKGYKENLKVQMLRYIDDITEGRIQTPTGRNIGVGDSTQFYCYAICDITKKIRNHAEDDEYVPMKDGYGYYKYHGGKKAHIEIIAFDKLIADATRRNKMFFQHLGID